MICPVLVQLTFNLTIYHQVWINDPESTTAPLPLLASQWGSYQIRDPLTVDLLRQYLTPTAIDLSSLIGKASAEAKLTTSFHLMPKLNSKIKNQTALSSSSYCVLMADDRPLIHPTKEPLPPIQTDEEPFKWDMPYWSETVYINLFYALRHGYQFWRIHVPSDMVAQGDRDMTWYKIPATLLLLRSGCQWVFFLDSDAFVADLDISLPSLAKAYQLDQPGTPFMLIPRDVRGWTDANCGAFLVRNDGKETEMFLEEWWNLPSVRPEFKVKYRERLHEQHTFNYGMIQYKDTKYRLTPVSLLTSPEGTFVRHYWADWKSKNLFHMETSRASMAFLRNLLKSMTGESDPSRNKK